MRGFRGGVDAASYLRAIPLLIRNPELMAVPFLMAIIGVAIGRMTSSSSDVMGGITGGLWQFVFFLLDAFGLAVSIIMADAAWRRGRGSFDDAWIEGRRKAGDILLAAIGLNFVLFVAVYAGQLLGNGLLQLILPAIALYFLIYTLPAAAIGGIPGGASLQVSIERVRQAPAVALLLTIVFVVVYEGIAFVAPVALGLTGISVLIAGAAFKAIALGYLSLVLAKNYVDTAFGRYR
jgi:hypothetical protein